MGNPKGKAMHLWPHYIIAIGSRASRLAGSWAQGSQDSKFRNTQLFQKDFIFFWDISYRETEQSLGKFTQPLEASGLTLTIPEITPAHKIKAL